ncbi:hypothetical protein [Sphaerisporangium aureirubrum]|uniref:DUF222 domain-containing protein n=1 Tax=Sphaerisporangium aureirubrum TaxID=1544736 RepID=A0ABW1NC90_9ACTN
MSSSNRVPGHTLVAEGAAFLPDPNTGGTMLNRTGWHGCGLCSCGETSDTLSSNNQRKRWHREHKDTIRGKLSSTIPPLAYAAAEKAIRAGVRIRPGEHAAAELAAGKQIILSGTEAEYAARLGVGAAAPIIAAHALDTATREHVGEAVERLVREAAADLRPELEEKSGNVAAEVLQAHSKKLYSQFRADVAAELPAALAAEGRVIVAVRDLEAIRVELAPDGRIGRTLLSGSHPTAANVARQELLDLLRAALAGLLPEGS